VDRDEAFCILQAREPELARTAFDISFRDWYSELRSAVLHGGRRLDTALRQRMQAALERFRPAVEDLLQREANFRHGYPGTRTNDGFFQTNLHHFVEFGCAPEVGEFAEAPPIPAFEGRNTGFWPGEGLTLLDFNESRVW
jgi:hypothetical protein